jgi:hypothetical protein
MAEEERKDLLARLADAGEDAIQRLADVPGAGKLTETLNGLRGRVDDLQRRVRGVEDLEQRVAGLEERVARLEGGPRRASRRRASTRTTAEGTTARAEPRRRSPRGTADTGDEPDSAS